MANENEIVRNISSLFDVEYEIVNDKYIFKKKRKAKLQLDNSHTGDILELDVYLECRQEKDRAFNKAEVFLLSEECADFTGALINHENPLPTSYRMRQVGSSEIVCIRMEAEEEPERFSERLFETLETMNEYSH